MTIRTTLVCLTAAGLATLASLAAAQKPAAESQPVLTVELARREVRMLDDLYKTSVVLINDTFVEQGASAGDAAREIFAVMRKKGWHDARLIDATGKPMNKDNVPKHDFEKKAIEKIKAGETYVDQVVEEAGQKYLRAATVVPVVNNKCVVCHPGNKVGGVLGAVSYKIPVK
jgi:hypothetical protein